MLPRRAASLFDVIRPREMRRRASLPDELIASRAEYDDLLAAAARALEEAGFSESVGKLNPLRLSAVRTANRELAALELASHAVSLSSCKLPRYLSALELHVTLAGAQAEDGGGTDADDSAELSLALEALRGQLKLLGSVRAEAVDMAKKMGVYDGTLAGRARCPMRTPPCLSHLPRAAPPHCLSPLLSAVEADSSLRLSATATGGGETQR